MRTVISVRFRAGTRVRSVAVYTPGRRATPCPEQRKRQPPGSDGGSGSFNRHGLRVGRTVIRVPPGCYERKECVMRNL
jgi:hypothetical protein